MEPEGSITVSGRLRSLAAVIAGAGLVGMVLSLTLPLLAIIMERRGASNTFIGVNTAMPALAMLLVIPWLPRLLGIVGTARVLTGCLLLAAVTLWLFHAVENLWLWFPIRIVNGFAIVTIFVATEAWIQALADSRRRGRIVALYTTCFSLGWAAGPAVLAIVGTEGAPPFIAAVVMTALAAVFIIAAWDVAPSLGGRPQKAVFAYTIEHPSIFWAVACFAAVEAGIFTLLPIYGLRLDLSPEAAALTLTAIGLGSAALQLPIGYLSDRTSRHGVLVVCALAGVGGAVTLPLVAQIPLLLYISVFIWAGLLAGMYTTAMAALGDTYEGADLVAATGTFSIMYGIGSLIGPPAAGVSMDLVDPHGLAIMLGAICAGYATLASIRGLRARRLTSGRQDGI